MKLIFLIEGGGGGEKVCELLYSKIITLQDTKVSYIYTNV
jgi:hypothetical protein